MTTYLITKTNGDDGSDIGGCLISISGDGLATVRKFAGIADQLSGEHDSFSAASFNLSDLLGDALGVEVFWLTTESEWQEDFNVGATDEHVFISREDFERLKGEARPDWQIGIQRIVFNSYGDCFIEGSYEFAHGCEESTMLPLSEIGERLSLTAESTAVA